MIQNCVVFRGLIALPFAGYHVQELRPIELAQIRQRCHEHVKVVPVNRPDIIEPEFLEQCPGHDHALHVFLRAPGKFQDRRHFSKNLLARPAGRRIKPAREQSRQIIIKRADIL